jgi:hypothetical protein
MKSVGSFGSTLIYVALVISTVVVVVIKTKESFIPKPNNVFLVEDTMPKTNQKKIIEGIKVPFQKNDLYEVSRDTFEHRDLLLSILKNHITTFTIFKDSISSIFISQPTPPVRVVFDVTIYDSKEFFAQKIRVYINDFLGSNPQVTLSEISDTEGVMIHPNHSDLEPSYYRILNTLHLSAPFKTTDYYNKEQK